MACRKVSTGPYMPPEDRDAVHATGARLCTLKPHIQRKHEKAVTLRFPNGNEDVIAIGSYSKLH